MSWPLSCDSLTLGIETSCDETAASVVRGGRETVSNVVASQDELHAHFGGIVPEVASRRHAELVTVIVAEAGGITTDRLGNPHLYDQEDPRFTSLVASGKPLHPLLIERTSHIDL